MRDGAEREVDVSRHAPEAAAAFGVEMPAPSGIHPLQAYAPADGSGFNRWWFGGLTAASVALLVALGVASDPPRTVFDGPPADLPPALAFDVTDTVRPARISLHQDLSQAWAEYDLTLTDPAGAVVAETGRGMSFYSGGSGEDSWSEGSRFATLGFAPTVPGTYSLRVALAEAATPGQARETLRIAVIEGRRNPLWAWGAVALFGLLFLWAMSTRLRHRLNRWHGSDWNDE